MGCSNGIYKKKSKEIRACADFSTGLNAALKDYHYLLPSPEEVFNESNGGKVFSKIDLSEAYLQKAKPVTETPFERLQRRTTNIRRQ